MTEATPQVSHQRGWTGIGAQAAAVVGATAAVFGVLSTLLDILVHGRFPSPSGFVFLLVIGSVFGFAFGLANGWLAALAAVFALRAWRNAAPTAPLRIAAGFALALALPWGFALLLGAASHPTRPLVSLPGIDLSAFLPVHVAVGVLMATFAWTATRRPGPTLACAVAGALASMPMGVLLEMLATDQPTAPLIAAAHVSILCACAFAGAWVYRRTEPRTVAGAQA